MPNETDSAYHGLSNLDRRLLTHTVPRREAGFRRSKTFVRLLPPSIRGFPYGSTPGRQRLALTKVPSVLRDQDLLFDPRGQTTVWFPIRALKWYLNRTQDLLGTSTSLFFLLRVPHSAAWEDTLSRCLVEAIRPLATGPGRSMAHNSRGFTASTALFAGFPIVDICKTTAWKTPIASSPATYRTYHRPIWLWSLDDTSSGVPPLGPPTIGQCHSVHRLWGDRGRHAYGVTEGGPPPRLFRVGSTLRLEASAVFVSVRFFLLGELGGWQGLPATLPEVASGATLWESGLKMKEGH
ncbi:hypothetical protein BSL78_04912 [Apostichopus japonicus]|uniref:Uncharacterized protein n=1 Tax=Stichopus japonicus TaxID=307972 RepID=A0A2G8LD44_STIJA|nr:hypothetical protein BSL78_04912 [Apostichopus japonicus]